MVISRLTENALPLSLRIGASFSDSLCNIFHWTHYTWINRFLFHLNVIFYQLQMQQRDTESAVKKLKARSPSAKDYKSRRASPIYKYLQISKQRDKQCPINTVSSQIDQNKIVLTIFLLFVMNKFIHWMQSILLLHCGHFLHFILITFLFK